MKKRIRGIWQEGSKSSLMLGLVEGQRAGDVRLYISRVPSRVDDQLVPKVVDPSIAQQA
jgi:hypothetical protein